MRDGDVRAERIERTAASHAGTLPRLVDEVLAEAGERPERGDAVAVAIGPGSFTGLRIGLSFAKGLAFASGLAIVGVPTLDALALAAPPWTGVLCAALDARKQEIYAALYTRDDGTCEDGRHDGGAIVPSFARSSARGSICSRPTRIRRAQARSRVSPRRGSHAIPAATISSRSRPGTSGRPRRS